MSAELSFVVALVHAGATWFMVGLIWFVQVVHYPLMRQLESPAFGRYAIAHQKLTGRVVAPVMIVELASAVALAFGWSGGAWGWWLCVCGLLLLGLVWTSTFLVQMRMHGRLGTGFDGPTCMRLVRTNWARTMAWTSRGVVALAILADGGMAGPVAGT